MWCRVNAGFNCKVRDQVHRVDTVDLMRLTRKPGSVFATRDVFAVAFLTLPCPLSRNPTPLLHKLNSLSVPRVISFHIESFFSSFSEEDVFHLLARY